MQLGQTRLLVHHFPECYRFYRDELGLLPSWGDESDSYASFKESAEGRIVLALFDRQEMAEVVGRGDWDAEVHAQDRVLLSFEVQDVDAEVGRLKQKGVLISVEPMDFPDWGLRGAYIRDPDGNLIELSGALPGEAFSEELRRSNEKWKDRGKS